MCNEAPRSTVYIVSLVYEHALHGCVCRDIPSKEVCLVGMCVVSFYFEELWVELVRCVSWMLLVDA